jgi:hypothetical protein
MNGERLPRAQSFRERLGVGVASVYRVLAEQKATVV